MMSILMVTTFLFIIGPYSVAGVANSCYSCNYTKAVGLTLGQDCYDGNTDAMETVACSGACLETWYWEAGVEYMERVCNNTDLYTTRECPFEGHYSLQQVSKFDSQMAKVTVYCCDGSDNCNVNLAPASQKKPPPNYCNNCSYWLWDDGDNPATEGGVDWQNCKAGNDQQTKLPCGGTCFENYYREKNLFSLNRICNTTQKFCGFTGGHDWVYGTKGAGTTYCCEFGDNCNQKLGTEETFNVGGSTCLKAVYSTIWLMVLIAFLN